MSFWSFLGGFAIFNVICDLFSSKHDNPPSTPGYDRHNDYGDDSCYRNDNYTSGASSYDDIDDQLDEMDDFDDF